MSAPDSLQDRLDFAVDLAWRAGRRTLSRFQAGIVAETKADHSPVTEADRDAERFCREAIALAYPGDGILGEEFGEERPGAARRWILDPIDGTVSFIQGVPLYAVLIALEERTGAGDAIAKLGVLHFPALHETVAAARGLGCRWNGRPARVSETARLEDACVLATDPRAASRAAEGAIDGGAALANSGWARLQAASRVVRGWGDAYGHALVATGRAEAMWDPVVSLWDSAPLQVVIEEAGGVFTDGAGRATHAGADALSTNARLAEAVRRTLGLRETAH